jgi:hypothetical protein
VTEQITIHQRFNGGHKFGQGGYVCGIVAGFIGLCAEVTLRSPTPLNLPLTIERKENGEVRLSNADVTIAEGRHAELRLDIPDPPTFEESASAAKSFPGFEAHPFPNCFACGHQRTEGDGLRIFSGPINGSDIMAAPWLPHASLAEDTGRVKSEFLWSALECPSGWAVAKLMANLFPEGTFILLGRFVAEIKEELETGQSCVTIGWPIGYDGRKLFGGSAIFSKSGELLAAGKATWIAVLQKTPFKSTDTVNKV